MAVRFNNYQPGAQFAAALDQADRQYQDRLALGWVPSERDPAQNVFGSFWDSFTSSAESTVGGALTAAGAMTDSPWLASLGGDVLRQSARYADWGNDYDDNPDKSRYSLEYIFDPHGLASDAGTMMGSSAPGMLAGAALMAGGTAIPVLGGLGALASAGMEIGANFGQGYLDNKRDNMEAQIQAGQRPTGSVYDGDIDQAAWGDLTKDPWKNAELIGSSLMDTGLDVITGMTGGAASFVGKGLAKAGLMDAMASGGGKVAGAVLGDAARADTMLGRAAYGLSTAGRPLEWAANRLSNAFGEGVQEAWQQRVQDAMGNKFDDDRADAGSFFRDIANGNWDNFTDAEKNSFNAAFLPSLVSGIGVSGIRRAGQYAYNNIDALGPTFEAKSQYNNLSQNMGIANALSDSTGLGDYIGHQYSPENPIVTHSDIADNVTTNIPLSNNDVTPDVVPATNTVLNTPDSVPDNTFNQSVMPAVDSDIINPQTQLVNDIRSKLEDAPDILQRAYNNADIDAINNSLPEGYKPLTPELLNRAMQGDTQTANYMLSVLGKKNVVNAIKARNADKKAQIQQAKQQIQDVNNNIKNIIKGVNNPENNQESIQQAQNIIHQLAPNGKAEELTNKVKSQFLKVNQDLLDRANNGDTKAMRDILRAIDPSALVQNQDVQISPVQAPQTIEPPTEPTGAPQVQQQPTTEPNIEPATQNVQNGANQRYSTGEINTPSEGNVVTAPQAAAVNSNDNSNNNGNSGGLSTAYVPGGAIDNNNTAPQNPQNGTNQRYSTQNQQVPTPTNVITPTANNAPQNSGNYAPAGAQVNTTLPNGMVRGKDSNRITFMNNITSQEDVNRGVNIIKRLKDEGKIDKSRIGHDTLTNALNGSPSAITQILDTVSDNDFDRLDNTGGNKHEDQVQQGTQNRTDNPAKEGTEVRGPTHQQGRVDNNDQTESSKSTESTHQQADSQEINKERLFHNDGGKVEQDNHPSDDVNSDQAENTLHQLQQDNVYQTQDEGTIRYKNYIANKVTPELETAVGNFYGSQTKMSFANLVTALPDAINYIAFLNGNKDIFSNDPLRELQARMQYRAVFGSLLSLGINLIKPKLTMANATDSEGNHKWAHSTPFQETTADVLNILPGAINAAILSYDGLRKKLEKDVVAGKPTDVPSLNTWFYFCLLDAYDRYVTQRAGSGVVLAEQPAKVKRTEIYNVLGDLFPIDREFATELLTGQHTIPEALHQYGITNIPEMLQWLTDANSDASRQTGRRAIIMAWQNAMQQGKQRDKLRRLLNEAQKTGDYSKYADAFIKSFSDVFTTLVNTPIGREAFDAYQTMAKLDDAVMTDVRKQIEKAYDKTNNSALYFGTRYITQILYGRSTPDGRSQAEVELEDYEKQVLELLEKKITQSKFLTRENRAVGLTKLAIIARALKLAQRARQRSLILGQGEQSGLLKEQKQMGDKNKNKLGDDYKTVDITSGYSVDADFAMDSELTTISNDYLLQARLARKLEIMSQEIQLCNLAMQLGGLRTSKILVRTNQDAAYLSPTDKAYLMQAFIVSTIENNFGDIAYSEFGSHAKDSDANSVREYGLNLIQRINDMFPTTITKRSGDLSTQIKDLDAKLNALCEEVQKNPLGKKLFGLTYSKNIVCEVKINGQFKNDIRTRRTPSFPWLNTPTSGKIMPADEFDRSKFVKQYVKSNKISNKNTITVSNIISLEKDKGKKKQATTAIYDNNMRAYGYDDDIIHCLNQFDETWMEDVWKKASKKLYPREPVTEEEKKKYKRQHDNFINRLSNAINKAKRAVLSVASMGVGKYDKQDFLATLKMDFATSHSVSKLDAVLLSLALEQHIKNLEQFLIKHGYVNLESAVPGHRVAHTNAYVYNYAITDAKKGIHAGTTAAEMSSKNIISNNGKLYIITDAERVKLNKGEVTKDELCHPYNRVVKSVRTTEGKDRAEGKTTGLNPFLIDNRIDQTYTNARSGNVLRSSGTIVGNIDTFLYDFFRIRDGIPNNVILKTLLVLDKALPLDTVLKNGLDGYISNMAKQNNVSIEQAREQVMNRLKNAATRFMRQEQMDIAIETRGYTRAALFGTTVNIPGSVQVKFREGTSELRNLMNFIARLVNYGDTTAEPNTVEFNDNIFRNASDTTQQTPTQKQEPQPAPQQTQQPQQKPATIQPKQPTKQQAKQSTKTTTKAPPKKRTKKYVYSKAARLALAQQYDRISNIFRQAMTVLQSLGGMYTVTPLKITTQSKVLRDKAIMDGKKVMTQDDRLATTTTEWTSSDTASINNPFAEVLRLLGSLKLSDIMVHVDSPVARLYDEIHINRNNDLLAFSDNVDLLDDAGLITSAHILSYKLAQKSKLTYKDINALTDMLMLVRERTGLTIEIRDALDSVTNATQIKKKSTIWKSTTTNKPSTDIVADETSVNVYTAKSDNKQLLQNLATERANTNVNKVNTMDKENKDFLVGMNLHVSDDADNNFAHTLFINVASKVLGVVPTLIKRVRPSSKPSGTTHLTSHVIQAERNLRTIYHELMHDAAMDMFNIDIANGKITMANTLSNSKTTIGKNFISQPLARLPLPTTSAERLRQIKIATKIIRNSLTDAMNELQKSDLLSAKFIRAIGEVVNLDTYAESFAHVLINSGLGAIVKNTQTGQEQLVTKVSANNLYGLYNGTVRMAGARRTTNTSRDYNSLVSAIVAPSILFGNQMVQNKTFSGNAFIALTETYSHLIGIMAPNDKKALRQLKTEFSSAWLYKSTELLRAIDSADKNGKIRNTYKSRITQDDNTQIKEDINELTNISEDTLAEEPSIPQNITAPDSIELPDGRVADILHWLANKRNPTMRRTIEKKGWSASLVGQVLRPGLRWLEKLIDPEKAKVLIDKANRAIEWQKRLNATSDEHIKTLKKKLTIKGSKTQTKQLRQYFNDAINGASERGRDLVEIFDMPVTAGKDTRCINSTESGQHAALKVYDDDTFIILHNQLSEEAAKQEMEVRMEKLRTQLAKEGKTIPQNQASWYDEDTGTMVFYACPDSRMEHGKFKNLFIVTPTKADGTNTQGYTKAKMRLQKEVIKECEEARAKKMKELGFNQNLINHFLAAHALYRALLTNAYVRERKRELRNNDIIGQQKMGFIHAYAPRYYARYILQKEVWSVLPEGAMDADHLRAAIAEGTVVQHQGRYYQVRTVGLGSFVNKSDRAKYKNEHPLASNERYVEMSRDDWIKNHGGESDAFATPIHSMGNVTNTDVSRATREIKEGHVGALLDFISTHFSDKQPWEGKSSIEELVDKLEHMTPEDKEKYGEHKEQLIKLAKGLRINATDIVNFKQLKDSILNEGAQFLAGRYAQERVSHSGNYSRDVVGSLQSYLHAVNNVEALTPFYRDITKVIKDYTGREYSRFERDPFESQYNVLCEITDNMLGRTPRPIDKLMREISIGVVDFIYKVPGISHILKACNISIPDLWIPAIMKSSIALQVPLKLGMLNVATGLAQYGQLANIYAVIGEKSMGRAMKKMPGIMKKAYNPFAVIKGDFDVSQYDDAIKQVMVDMNLTKQGKMLYEQDVDNAFKQALAEGNPEAYEIQALDGLYSSVLGSDELGSLSDMASQFSELGDGYEGESLADHIPKNVKKVNDILLMSFSGGDKALRLFTAVAAEDKIKTSEEYAQWRELHKDDTPAEYNAALMLEMRDIISRTNFSYNRGFDPLMVAKGGLVAKCAFQFASYGFQQFNFIEYLLRTKDKKKLARFFGSMLLFAGVTSTIPMMTMISGMLQAITGTNPEDWIKQFIMKAAGRSGSGLAKNTAEALCYGILAPILGIDISKKIGLSDIMKDPTDFRNLAGPAVGTLADFSTAAGATYDSIANDKYTSDQLMFAWFKAVPALTRYLQAARGQYYSYSKLMPKTEYQSMSDSDRVRNILGFNPVDNRMNTDINRYITDTNKEYSDAVRSAMISYVNNPSPENLKRLQSYGKTPKEAHKAVDKLIKPKITAEQAEKMVTKAKNENADMVRSDVRALGTMLN